MGINEKQPTGKKYVAILRNNAAIEAECADVYMKDSWVEFKDAHGMLEMAIPIDLVLMITTPDRFAMFQQAAADEAARQQAVSPIVSVDPAGILDPATLRTQP